MRAAFSTLGELLGLGIVVYGLFMWLPVVGTVALGLGLFAISFMASFPPRDTGVAQSKPRAATDNQFAPPHLATVTDLGMTSDDR